MYIYKIWFVLFVPRLPGSMSKHDGNECFSFMITIDIDRYIYIYIYIFI